MRPEYTTERARSAKEGSATAGCALVEPLACFPEGEDIAGHPALTTRLFHGATSSGSVSFSNCGWRTNAVCHDAVFGDCFFSAAKLPAARERLRTPNSAIC